MGIGTNRSPIERAFPVNVEWKNPKDFFKSPSRPEDVYPLTRIERRPYVNLRVTPRERERDSDSYSFNPMSYVSSSINNRKKYAA